MENQTNNQAPKSGLLNQPRKAVSGLVYSGTIIGMVIISLLFAISAIFSFLFSPLIGKIIDKQKRGN